MLNVKCLILNSEISHQLSCLIIQHLTLNIKNYHVVNPLSCYLVCRM
jgi:hypothetical protein